MNHKYKIVDVPGILAGGRGQRPNAAIPKLLNAVSELPEGRGILVTPEMFGWGASYSGYGFRSQLCKALKNFGAPVRVAQRAGSVYVMRAEGK